MEVFDYRFFDFSKLWIVILLSLSPSTVRTSTEVVSKFCMWEVLVTQKIRLKNSIFSKMVWNFCVASAPLYGDRGLYRTAAKSWRLPWNWIFYTELFKGSLEIFHRSCGLCRSVEVRWPHSCIIFKRFLLIPYRKKEKWATAETLLAFTRGWDDTDSDYAECCHCKTWHYFCLNRFPC